MMMMMINRTVKNEKNDVCIICLDDEVEESSMKFPDAIHRLSLSSLCNCSCDVHAKCVAEWLDISSRCPICRIPLQKYGTSTYWSIGRRRQQLNREYAKKMIIVVLTIPIYLGMHLFIFYISMYAMIRMICAII